MTVIEKINQKKSKKGFTLVELVIVIAILAILAAIAIPAIKTTINSAKMSVLKSDCETLQILFDEAFMTYREGNRAVVTYNGKSLEEATYKDIILEAGLDWEDFDTFHKPRVIAGKKYYFYWMGGKIVYSTVYCNWPMAGATGKLPARIQFGYENGRTTIKRMVAELEYQERRGIHWDGKTW